MKRFSVVTALALLLPLGASAQTLDVHAACTFGGGALNGRVVTEPPDARTERITRAILSTVGLEQSLRVRSAQIPNAAALVQGETRYVLYNPDFLDELSRHAHTPWAGISVLAHEIGHHLGGHTLDDDDSKPVTELEADRFSGFVLARLGATLDEAQAAMRLMGSRRGTRSHPGRDARLAAIRQGWEQADAPLPLGLVERAGDGTVSSASELVRVHGDSFTRSRMPGAEDALDLPRITPGLTRPPSRRHGLPERGISGAATH